VNFLTAVFAGAAGFAFTFMPLNETYLQLETASKEPAPARITEVGLAVFDLEVNSDGRVVNDSTIQGGIPFIERSRLAFNDWRFIQTSRNAVHVNATFLYKPRLDLPDSRSAFNIPRPEAKQQIQSPVPVKIVDPGYPAGGMSGGEVILQSGLDPDGSVRSISVIDGPPMLAEVAVKAARQWKFDVTGDLDPLSRTSVIVMYFEAPKTEAADTSSAEDLEREAVFVSGESQGIPAGSAGVLSAGDAATMVFRYGDSHWTLPYLWITEMKYNDSRPGGDLLSITFSETANQKQTVTFRLDRNVALSIASALSSRSGKPMEFVRG
jgi:hypothetical protein